MADVKKGEGLVYKNHPLRQHRQPDLLMAPWQISISSCSRSWNPKRSRIWTSPPAFRAASADRSRPEIRDRVVKKSEKSSLYAAMDVGSIWLERALAGKL